MPNRASQRATRNAMEIDGERKYSYVVFCACGTHFIALKAASIVHCPFCDDDAPLADLVNKWNAQLKEEA